jgi:septal ring factor EnvC (AmiA/AmiB activator)
MLKKTLILILFTTIGILSFCQQSKEELQRKQQDLIKEINSLNKTLGDIRKSKKQSIGQLELVKRKIHAREELIQNINRDVRVLNDNIYLSTVEINKLKKELDTLKREYAQSLVFAYKNRSNYDYLNFIFSAASFNDAIKRVTYLKSYRQYREQQVSNINKTQLLIENKIAALNNNKNNKNLALQDQGKQLKVLETDRKEQDQVVSQLKSKENDIASEIKNRDRQRQKMKEAIAAIIRREQREAMERARIAKLKEAERIRKEKEAAALAAKNTPPKTTPATGSASPKSTPSGEPATTGVASTKGSNRTYSPFESTEEGKRESISFENGRGSLPWPVDAGYVSIHFGPYSVPNSKIKGQSDGISISLPVGASVKAVAEGEVSSVFDLGGEQAVLIRHGKYFTTYSHLSSANVSRGQQVRAGTLVGRAAANEEGEGEVLFMVTNEKGSPLNPEGWLRRR